MATTINGNGKLIPVDFSIAEVECALAWEWFLHHLKIFLAIDPSILTIVSNRHRGIISTVSKVYLNAHHVFCCYHLFYNMVTDTRDRLALGLFWVVTRANTIV